MGKEGWEFQDQDKNAVMMVLLCISAVQYVVYKVVFVHYLTEVVQASIYRNYKIPVLQMRKQAQGFSDLPKICKLVSNGVGIKKNKCVPTEPQPSAVSIFLYPNKQGLLVKTWKSWEGLL